MRLRPYKSYDAKKIISWIKDEEVFLKWGGDHFGLYPISAEIIDNKYLNDNGDCKEEDNFYPWIAFTDEDGVIGHFIMRYIHGNNKVLRFGWVIVDDSIRGKGYGTDAVKTMVKYAFDELRLHCVYANIISYNDVSVRLFERCGFQREGVLRDRIYKGGRYVDELSYSIINQ
jgi:RimJ/RimL family protein N-acetyltransferase